KEEGVAPWEIWVSESQERMMCSVKKENLDKVLEIFEFWDVPARIVGEVDNSCRIKAKWKHQEILNLDLEFLIKGVVYERKSEYVERDYSEPEFDMPDLVEATIKVLSSSNISSRECIIRRYDHEVRGDTVIKPMQGVVNLQTHGDASVIKPLKDSFQGLAITSDINPRLCQLDPYWGAASAVEETVRNLVSVGARPHSLADCLNFGNPEKPDRLADFQFASQGLHHVASALNLPFVSGNVSFYNESHSGAIPPTPTILGVGIVEDVRKVVTSDLKKQGNLIYLIGDTKKELGASEYYAQLGLGGGSVPHVDVESLKKKIKALPSLMGKGIIKSCHDLSEGGLIIALAEMCFGGDMGCDVDLKEMGDLRSDFKLFSESNGRWLVEVEEKNAKKVESELPAVLLGKVISEKRMKIKDGKTMLDLSLTDLREEWKSGIEKES
ncbi:AIR synthase-related protein, partial [Candidatus Altiarchaeota archaeon]